MTLRVFSVFFFVKHEAELSILTNFGGVRRTSAAASNLFIRFTWQNLINIPSLLYFAACLNSRMVIF